MDAKRSRPRAAIVGATALLLLLGALIGFVRPFRTTLPPSEDVELLRALGYVDWHAAPSPGRSGVTHHDAARAYPGYSLYTNDVDEVYLEALDGSRVHSWALPGRRDCEHAELLPDGRLAVVCVNEALVLLEWDSSIAWQLEENVHHDVARRPDGTLLVPVVESDRFYMGRNVVFDSIVEVSPNGEVVRRWSTYEAREDLARTHGTTRLDRWPAFGRWVDLGLDLVRGREPPSFDYFHVNSVEVLGDTALGRRDPRFRAGNLLVSLRNVNVVAVLDQEDFAVTWHWGEGRLDMQHQPTLTAEGTILVFDNGTRRGFSRVLEIDPLRDEIVWAYLGDPPETFFNKWQGGAQRLPNGNTLICDSALGRVIEVSKDGALSWEFWNPDVRNGERRGIYRFARLSEAFVEPILAREGRTVAAAAGDPAAP